MGYDDGWHEKRLVDREVDVIPKEGAAKPQDPKDDPVCELKDFTKKAKEKVNKANLMVDQWIDVQSGKKIGAKLKETEAKKEEEETREITAEKDVEDLDITWSSTPPDPLVVQDPGSWGSKKGLKEGDEVVAINGKSDDGLSAEELDKLLADRPVTFTLKSEVTKKKSAAELAKESELEKLKKELKD